MNAVVDVWAGLAIGFIGSLHCLGMCGPIVLTLPGAARERWRFLGGRLLYNVGRALTYAALGALVGIVGQSFALAGYQRWLGIAAGVLMIVTVTLPADMLDRFPFGSAPQRLVAALQRALRGLLETSSLSGLFAIGLLNGLLPCGLVYTALAGSLAMGGIMSGGLFMLLFGLGTLPVLFAFAYAAGFITAHVRAHVRKILPLGVIFMGVFFILRGLSLGIPFLSPDIEKMKTMGPPAAVADTIRATPACCR